MTEKTSHATSGVPASDLEAIALLDEPARRRLYEWVSAQGRPVGREEAAEVLGISRALAAFHLDRLADAGLLETGYKRLTGRSGPGAGRPARVYWRAEREFAVSVPPRRYDLVANVFAEALQEIGAGGPPSELVAAARSAGERLASGSATGPETGLFSVLDQAGYQPVLDAGGTIRLRNCPFDALVDEHRPLVCGTNLALAEGIVAGSESAGERAHRPRLDPQPGYCCVVFGPPND